MDFMLLFGSVITGVVGWNHMYSDPFHTTSKSF